MFNSMPPSDKSKKLRTRLIDSRLLGWVANFPPIAFIISKVTSRIVGRSIAGSRMGEVSDQEIESRIRVGMRLDATLQGIVSDVVSGLGYVGAMVAPYEQGDVLPVRAFYVDPKIANLEQIKQWEAEVSKIKGEPISISDPEIARAYRYKEEFKDNLSVKAIEAGELITSDELYSLFTPVAPSASKPIVAGIQEALRIKQVIAVPFFLETSADKREVVGNLFAASRRKFSEQDKLILSAFGRQAAAAIELEQRRDEILKAYKLVYGIQTSLQDETQILQHIAKGVVNQLGYVGAMVASYELDDSLPVRAFYVDPKIANLEQIKQWEAEVSKIKGEPISISDPEIARAYRYKEEFKDNLSVKAIEAGELITSDELYSLFTPVAPSASKPIVAGIQEALRIKQVIAVPFFLETPTGKRKVVGNLFAASRSRSFAYGEIELLKAFGEQAAIGIQNAQLYHRVKELLLKSEARREVAQIFAKMAFNANTAVHDLSNKLGLI